MFNKEKKIVFDTLFEAISEAVIVVDKNQNITTTNSSTNEMFGYHKEELLGKSLEILIPQKYKKDHGSHFKGFIEKQSKRQMGKGRELYAKHKKGKIFPIEVGLNPFEIDGERFVMALVVDVSLRKHQELEILELNTKLENKVKERTRSLSTNVEKLEKINQQLDEENKKRIEAEQKAKVALKKERELNELKTNFLSMVSHEFKTPLSGILTSTIILGKLKITEKKEQLDKYVSIISSKVHFLNNILNDFLSVEKLEKGEFNYNFYTFDLIDLIDEVVNTAKLILKPGQKIICNSKIDDLTLYQDEKILEHSLINLLSNAIKYSPEDTLIKLKVVQDNKQTIFEVKDEGYGIPKKDQKNIFQRYFRAENVLLNEGTGIGLNIIKNHLNNLGGTITFVSKEHVGSTFTITLPNKIDR